MALVKKGSRLITVNGTTYRWRLRGRPTYGQGVVQSPLTFAVEQRRHSRNHTGDHHRPAASEQLARNPRQHGPAHPGG